MKYFKSKSGRIFALIYILLATGGLIEVYMTSGKYSMPPLLFIITTMGPMQYFGNLFYSFNFANEIMLILSYTTNLLLAYFMGSLFSVWFKKKKPNNTKDIT